MYDRSEPGSADVLVVGGGFAGLTAGYRLARQGKRVTVLEAGPLLPAEAATNTPASAANKKAISVGSAKLVCVPLIEKLMTSTPSATAWSMALMLSEL